jgi:hypothetical protein
LTTTDFYKIEIRAYSGLVNGGRVFFIIIAVTNDTKGNRGLLLNGLETECNGAGVGLSLDLAR